MALFEYEAHIKTNPSVPVVNSGRDSNQEPVA
jgi:hypothetical protein